MRVAVTGATGFLGRAASLRLAGDGIEVTALGRNSQIGERLNDKYIKFTQVDLEKADNLDRIFAGHDAVIHCAALSSPWGRYQDFYAANVIGTENVLTAAQQAKVKRVVHVSTPSLYVDRRNRMDVRESEPLPDRGINFYAQTKKMAEDRVDQAVRKGLEVVVLRPQGIVGAGDTAILPRLLRVAKKGVLPVIGRGDNWVDLTFVENVVDALLLAMRAPSVAVGRKYNVTNGEPVRLYETVDEIFGKLGIRYRKKMLSFKSAYAIAAAMEFSHRTVLRWKEPLLTRYSVCAMGLTRTLNIEAARRDLGYRPRVSMAEAVTRVIESLQ